ncbi:sulfurtransferase [Allohahella marinimesophila]|uniref:Rhodanese-like domain-containing protein n=1 Tax=Allohahella marinimesophila TaxID=1054972 RepID=A0ABP7NIN3_9GAMM
MTHTIASQTRELTHWSLLIQAQHLLDYMQRPAETRVLVVDLSPRSAYEQQHVEGAVWLDPTRTKTHPPFNGKLPELQQLRSIAADLDLHQNDHLVVMDAEGGAWAGRFVWLMLSMGFKNVHAIDGGRLAWEALGLPMVAGDSSSAEGADDEHVQTGESANIRGPIFLPDENSVAASAPTVSVDLAELKRLVEAGQAQVWDARSAEEFSGQRVTARNNGHIPGARHLEWTRLLDPHNHYRLRSPEALNELLLAAGLDPELPIITHCQTHHRSGLTFLAGRQLGLDIKAYPGSWSEWGNSDDTGHLIEQTGDA